MREGLWVDYISRDGRLEYGSTGYVLSSDGTSAHVMWKSGSLSGQVGLHYLEDITEHRSAINSLQASLNDSLEYGVMDDAYTTSTIGGSIEHPTKDIITEAAKEAASEAFALVVSRLEANPIFRMKLSQQEDPETRDLMIQATAKRALRDLLTEED